MTPEQKKWIAGVQRALSAPGSDGLGFFTIGDADVSIYDSSKEGEIDKIMSGRHGGDFCQAVDKLNARIGRLDFPTHVHSTAG